jgi:hypothetical protein
MTWEEYFAMYEIAGKAGDQSRASDIILQTGLIMATYVAVAPEAKGRLCLTAGERAEIVSRLGNGGIARAPRFGGSAFDVAAGAFFGFFSD